MSETPSEKQSAALSVAPCSAIEIVRAFNAWRRSNDDNSELPHSPVEIGQAIDEVVKLAKQAKCLRAQLLGIKARIEDSPYYGRIAMRGAVRELNEIADTAHNAIQCADALRASPDEGANCPQGGKRKPSPLCSAAYNSPSAALPNDRDVPRAQNL